MLKQLLKLSVFAAIFCAVQVSAHETQPIAGALTTQEEAAKAKAATTTEAKAEGQVVRLAIAEDAEEGSDDAENTPPAVLLGACCTPEAIDALKKERAAQEQKKAQEGQGTVKTEEELPTASAPEKLA